MHAHNRIWLLMARSLSNEATQEEKQELQAALRQDASLQQEYAMLQQSWNPQPASGTGSSPQVTSLLEKAKRRERHTSGSRPASFALGRKRIWWSAAAVFLMLAVGAYFIYQPAASPLLSATIAYNDSVTTQHGSRTRLILPDGSRVWLNSGSRLLYQKDFTGRVRQVELVGEAYFDVVKMPDKPFIVHAEGVRIRVLGTTFNVKCYPKDDHVETTLLHGAVSVTRSGEPDKTAILLRPNEKLSIRKQVIPVAPSAPVPGEYRVERLDTTVRPSHLPETAWVYNRLEFRGDDFATLAVKMERWYNVQIRFREERLKSLRFIGSFENETVDQALVALQAVSRFNYKINGNEILINPSY